MMHQLSNTTAPRNGASGDLIGIEALVMTFFDRHANYYVHSWDRREHGLHVGIFDGSEDAEGSDGDALESGYQRSRDHVIELLRRMRPLGADARVLDVCCGTGATLSQIAHSYRLCRRRGGH